jgi:hypothetical protein
VSSDGRLPWIIFASLVALIAVPVLLWRAGEARRPVLAEVRVVTADAADPVFRTGPRRVGPAGGLEIAAALRLERPGRDDVWLAPVDRLVVDGEAVAHVAGGDWPEDDRVLRVFWFTVEPAFLGGDLEPDDAGRLLGLRSYLAPEMGRGLRARTVPEQHNDDQINLGGGAIDVGGGTIRLYARVEIAERADAVASVQAASSPGVEAAGDPGFPELRLAAALPPPLDPALGELFRLPGFEPRPAPGGDPDGVTVPAFGASFAELVERRRVVSSWTFAAVALTGAAALDRDALVPLGALVPDAGWPSRADRRLRWGDDVAPGDLLEDRGQVIVLVADDGDGELGPADRVATCWRRPPIVTTLGLALRADAVSLAHLRHGG